MNLQQRRIKVLENLLEDTIKEKIAIEIGIEVKKSLLLMMPNHPQAGKIDEAINQSYLAAKDQEMAIQIMQRKLEEETLKSQEVVN